MLGFRAVGPAQAGGVGGDEAPTRRRFKASKTEAFSGLRAWDRALVVTTLPTWPVSDSKPWPRRVCRPPFRALSRKATRMAGVRTRLRVKALGLVRCSATTAGSWRDAANLVRIVAW